MSLNNEIWKDIDGLDGYYQISSHGRVKSLPRFINTNAGGFYSKEKYLAPFTDKDGYKGIVIQFNNVKYRYKVHRLVALAFIPNYENKPQVNHENGIKDCNFDWNLTWATNGENQKHAYDKLGKTSALKGRVGENAISSKKVLQFKDGVLLKEFNSLAEASKEIDVDPSTISGCIIGRQKQSKGFTFKLK